VNTLCFMPTLALANSLTFRNIDNPDKFPRIIVFGTIGWICSSLVVGSVLGETNPWLFFLAGGMELVLAAYCFTLPHTPPKRGGAAKEDVFGFKALSLLKEPSFLLFVVCAFLIVIPTSFYFAGCNLMLTEKDLPAPTSLQALAQVSEIFVMFAMPWFIATMGLRTVLVLGMAAWAVRSLLFATMSFPLIVLALLLHGFAYCFVFIGSYIFVDKKAPPDLRASAQSFISFLMLGLGMFLGSLLSGATIDQYPPYVDGIPASIQLGEGADIKVTPADRVALPKWETVASHLGMNRGEAIALGNLRAKAKDGLRVEDPGFAKKHVTIYSEPDLERVLMKIDDRKEVRTRGDFRSATDPQTVISVNRSDWLAAQVHRWTPMWLWFALGAGAICVFFAIGAMFTSDEEVAVAPPPEPPAPAPAPSEPAAVDAGKPSVVEWTPAEPAPPPSEPAPAAPAAPQEPPPAAAAPQEPPPAPDAGPQPPA